MTMVNPTPLISIILPTYNVAKYIQHCLESIKKQTYTNYEVIIIVDGSTDDTYKLAEEFCKNNSKFFVYWQENQGSGPARNNGIQKSHGELITFIDPDDWIGPEYLTHLIEKQREHDYDLTASYRTIVYFAKNGTEKKRSYFPMIEQSSIDSDTIKAEYYEYRNIITNPTCKLYKRSILINNDIQFPDLRRSQDIVFNYRYYEFTNSIGVYHGTDYFYRVEYRERINRLRSDYYLTIVRMFSEIKEMHDRLGVPFPVKTACNIEYFTLLAVLEAITLRSESYSEVFRDKTIKYIIANARPNGLANKLRYFVIRSGNEVAIRMMMKIIIWLKTIIM